MATMSEVSVPDAAAMSQLQQNGDKLAATEEADVPQKKYGDIIVVKRSGRDGSRFPILSNTNITIGRSENCNIRVVLETVSEEHVIISIDERKKLVVKNLAKMGGSTFLNKVLMLPNETTGLYAGDIIGVCDREFRIELLPTDKTPDKSRASAPRKERAFSSSPSRVFPMTLKNANATLPTLGEIASPAETRKMSGTKRSFSSSPSRVLTVAENAKTPSEEASRSPARKTIRSAGRAIAHSSTKAVGPPPSKIPTKQRPTSMQLPFKVGLPRPSMDPFASPSLHESLKKWKAESPRTSVQSTPKEVSEHSYLIDMDAEVSPLTGQSRQSVRIQNLLDATLTPGHSSRLSVVQNTQSTPVGQRTPVAADIVHTIPETSEYDSDHAVDDSMATEVHEHAIAEHGEDGRQVPQLDKTKERMTLTPTVAAPSPISTVAVPSAEKAKDNEQNISVSHESGASQMPNRRSSRLRTPKSTSSSDEQQSRQSVGIRNLLDATLTPVGLGHGNRLSFVEKTASSPVGQRTPIITVTSQHDSDHAVDDSSEFVPPTPTSSLPPFSTAAVVQVAEVNAIDKEAVSDSPAHAGATPSMASGRRSSRLSSSKESSEGSVFEVTPVRTAASSMMTADENERDLPELNDTSDYVPATPTVALPPISTVAVPSPEVGKSEKKAARVSSGPASSKRPNRRSKRLTSPKETSGSDVNEEMLVATEVVNQLTTRIEDEHNLPQLDETNDYVPSTPTTLLPPFSAVTVPSVVNEKDNEETVTGSPSFADASLIPTRRSSRLLTPKDTCSIDVNEEALVEQKKKTPNRKTPHVVPPTSSRRSSARKESPKQLMSTSPHVVLSTPKVASNQDEDQLIDMDKEVSPLTDQSRQSVRIRNLLDATLTPAGFGHSSRLSVVQKTASTPVGQRMPSRAEIVDTIPETAELDSDQTVDDSVATEVDQQLIAEHEDDRQVPQLDENKELMPLTSVAIESLDECGASQMSNRRSNRLHSPKVTSSSDEQTKKTPNTPSPLPVRRSSSKRSSATPSARLHSPKVTSSSDEQQSPQSVAIRNLLDAAFDHGNRLSIVEKTASSPVGQKTPVITETSQHDSDHAVDDSMAAQVDEQVVAEHGEDGDEVPQLEQTKERMPLTPTVAAPSPISTVAMPSTENAKDKEHDINVSLDQSGTSQTPNRRSNRVHSPKVTSSSDEQTKKTPNTPSPLPVRRSSSKRSLATPSARPASPTDVHEEDQLEEIAHNSSQPSFTPPKSPRVPVKSVLRLARVAASDSDSSTDSKRKVVFTPEPAVKFIPRIGTKSVRETERLENEEKKAAAKRAAETLEAQSTEEAPAPSPAKKSPARSPVKKSPTPSPAKKSPVRSPVKKSPTPSPAKKSTAAEPTDVAIAAATTETAEAPARKASTRTKTATAVRTSPAKKPVRATRKKNTTEDAAPPSLEATATVQTRTPATKRKAATSAVSATTAKKAKPASRKTAAQKTVATAVVDDHSPPTATKGAATHRNKRNMQLPVVDQEEHAASPPKRSRRSAKKEVSEAVEVEPAAPSKKPGAKNTATTKAQGKKAASKTALTVGNGKKMTRKVATKTEEMASPPAKKAPAARRTKQSSQSDAEDGSLPPKRGRPSVKNANAAGPSSAVEVETVATKTSKKPGGRKAAPKKVTVEASPQAETVVKRVTKRTKQPAEVTVEPPTKKAPVKQAKAVAMKTSTKAVTRKSAPKKVAVESPPQAEPVVKRVTKRGKQPAEPPTKSVRGRKAAAAAKV